MEDLLSSLLTWVEANPLWTGLVVFAVSLAESLAIVGIIVPGVVVLFGVGALIAAGAADFWAMCAWAVAGAVIGDGLSYWLGRRYKDHLRETWPFTRYPRTLEQGERFFEKYGGISVAFARFFGPGRATVPLVAGMLEMRPAAFLAANVGSALLWAPAYLIPGVVLGASLELASEVAFGLAVLILAVVGLSWFAGWLAHRVFLGVQPHARTLVQRLVRAGERVRWMQRIADALADPDHPEARGLAIFGSLLILGAVALAVASTLLIATQPLSGLDMLAADLMSSLRNPGADRLLAPLALPHPLAFTAFAGLAVALALGLAGRRYAVGHWLAGLAFVGVAGVISGIAAPAAEQGVLTPDTGLLALAVAVGLLAVLLARTVSLRLRWAVYAAGVVLVVLGGLSRLYFGLAGPGSLLIGALLALTWVAGVGVAYRTHAVGEPIGALTAGWSLGLFLLAGGGVNLTDPPSPQLPRESAPTIWTQAEWLRDGWRELPHMRVDLRHTATHPLNLQYAGELAALDAPLRRAGWQRESPAGPRQLVRLLSPSLPLARMPLLPHVHDGRHEVAAWIYPDEERRLVLRLWPTSATLAGGEPVWVGAVSEQVKRERFGLLAYPVTTPAFDPPLAQLHRQLREMALVLRQAPGGEIGLLYGALAPHRGMSSWGTPR
jgi:undecaprenyl-diphosphatase